MTTLRRFSTVALAFLLTLATALPVSAGSIINAASVILSQTCTTANAIPYLTTASTTAAVFGCSNLVQSANSLDLYNAANVQSFGWYTTRTDASNYERGRLFGVAGTGITIAAETAGTGGDNLGITLTPAGTGNLTLASGQLLLPTGTAANKSIAQASVVGTGINFRNNNINMGVAGAEDFTLTATALALSNANVNTDGMRGHAISWGGTAMFGLKYPSTTTLIQRSAAGTDAMTFDIVNTTDDTYDNFEIGGFQWTSNELWVQTTQAGSGVARPLVLTTRGNAPVKVNVNAADRWQFTSAGNIVAINADPIITAGSGTGVTVNSVGQLQRLTYSVTVTYAALAAAGPTADKTIATLPAKTRLVGIVADTTTPYTGGGVTAATLIVGKSVGGNEYLVSHNVFSAAITRGLVDSDLGTSINRASAVQGGDLASWIGTTAISVRLGTTTANTNQLTAGSTTYYLTTEKMP